MCMKFSLSSFFCGQQWKLPLLSTEPALFRSRRKGGQGFSCLQHFLGHFKSEEEGARAYDRALLTRKKKDGLLNFPLSDYADIVGPPEDSDAYDFLKPGQANIVGFTQGQFAARVIPRAPVRC